MLHFSVLVAFLVGSVQMAKKDCNKLGDDPFALNCCTDPIPPITKFNSASAECSTKVEEEDLKDCDVLQCVGSTLGVLGENGTVHYSVLESVFTEVFESSPDLHKNMIENCAHAGVMEFGSEDTCDMLKIGLCMRVQVLMSCKTFGPNDCASVEELVRNCLAD